MNTNTNIPQGIPSVEEIQSLANQYFKEIPNEVPKEISLDPYDHPKATGFAQQLESQLLASGQTTSSQEDLVTSGIGLNSSFPLGSASGLGISPSVATSPQGSGVSSATDNSFLQNQALAQGEPSSLGKVSGISLGSISSEESLSSLSIPSSSAGSGVSPSYTHQQTDFGLDEPITSFPDKNIDKKEIKNIEDSHSFLNEFTLFSEVDQLLKNIEQPQSSNFAVSDFGLAEVPSYYFLEDTNNAPSSLSQLGKVQGFDPYKVKQDFPILNEKINGKPLVWFDNAATTQKPQLVIDRMAYFYQHENSNIHRAAHELAARATDAYEAAREKVRGFLGARSANEIIFVRGATEAINLVANSWGEQYLKPGDEIIVSNLEHHANIVPWKRLADRKGLLLKVIPVDDDGQIILEEYSKLLTPNTKLVSFTQVSNALGTVTPAEQMVAMAHAVGARVLVDGAQSVSHMPVNVQTLDADWFVFSGHKVFGPTGIGVVYGKEDLLNATEPWQGGGNMIQDVTFEQIQYHKAPNRFEAGTGNIADAVGLGAAIDYVTVLGMNNISAYEHALLQYATERLVQIPGVRIIGTAKEKASVLSFNLKGYSNDDVGKALDREGIAVRTGHHCAQPILRRMGVETTVRPSLAFYNTCEDVDRFISVVSTLSRRS